MNAETWFGVSLVLLVWAFVALVVFGSGAWFWFLLVAGVGVCAAAWVAGWRRHG